MSDIDRKRLIEIVLSETDKAVGTANYIGGLTTEEMMQVAQTRALAAIADALASIDKRLERLIETLENRGPQ